MTTLEQKKTAINARVKFAMHDYLRSKSWPEKIRSIERMNKADKVAKEAMAKALARTP